MSNDDYQYNWYMKKFEETGDKAYKEAADSIKVEKPKVTKDLSAFLTEPKND